MVDCRRVVAACSYLESPPGCDKPCARIWCTGILDLCDAATRRHVRSRSLEQLTNGNPTDSLQARHEC